MGMMLPPGWIGGSYRQLCHSKSATPPFRVLFFGTDRFAVQTLQALRQQQLSPHGAVSQLEVCSPPMRHLVPKVRAYSAQEGLILHDQWPPPIKTGTFDLGIVASFGKMIPRPLIQSFPLGILNVHASLLPRWRGASPIAHALMHGDTETGISIMEIEPHHFDVGVVLAQQKCGIGPNETRQTLTDKLSVMGANLMIQVIQNLSWYRGQKQPQSTKGVTYAPHIDKTFFEIRWEDKTAQEIFNQYRALHDMSKLWSYWAESGHIVRFSSIIHPDIIRDLNCEQVCPEALPGRTIHIKCYRTKDHFVCIKAKKGWVAFQEFYYDKRKVMKAVDFFNGFISKHENQRGLYFTRMTPT
ncbi:methionyl-tRNA formyltransferase, mitochondrial-like [Tigriopus californicus]|uniref:methionyl-tRNA formyltransferase, mitochondrial-like n=1 Tax=Tigriopus californicus TaxID=6832 RepID=UPI0027DA8990|nr:methionyl-tRNA formyltransferase, mitochondrial-like [Tigriopus californicus]XP_059092296.1 methionyl-tRNA formyltransferase, mitochondrial-like [Tigriopus californicus]|eukprot:TCALIF_04119-PA protein Name:"Similar to Mtfmt Methionyl-tRNA formyltransferase, mitochondrial (Mus musculus)" AED:0.10 eAED:0.10 QI:121/1/1/1/0.5/0.4/5/25/354